MKNKIKKIIPFFLILLVVLTGVFGPTFGVQKAGAQTPGVAQCFTSTNNAIPLSAVGASSLCTAPNVWKVYQAPPPAGSTGGSPCTGVNASGVAIDASGNTGCTPATDATQGGSTPTAGGACTINGVSGTWNGSGASATCTPSGGAQTDFQKAIGNQQCGLWPTGTLFPGCAIQVSYGLFYQFPAWLLAQTAYFFNVLIDVTLNSTLLHSSFVAQAWTIVRDLSNLFFILVLLYVAIELILGLGHDAKKIIVEVIIIALLINFSMFFTEVIIDASNIVALIFYNKISVVTTDATGNSSPRPYASVSGEKDVAGGMVSAFDPTTTLTNQNFFNQATKVYDVTGTEQPSAENGGKVPASVLFGITVLAGAIMLFACYALFIAGISFLGRLIELWVLIIFSPFAFMSSTIPILETAEYIGWKAWFSRLLKVAFMAAIFMFFLYFIFMLIHANIFGTLIALTPGASGPAATIKTILGIVLPTFFILILLMKATKFAKEGSGALGEMLIKGTEIAMGVVAGVGLGVAAKGLQGTVGQVSSRMANSEWAKKREAEGKFGGALFRKTTQGLARSSFDVRQGAVGGVLAAAGGISGLNLGHSSKLFKEAGGFEADKKKRSESRVARSKRTRAWRKFS